MRAGSVGVLVSDSDMWFERDPFELLKASRRASNLSVVANVEGELFPSINGGKVYFRADLPGEGGRYLLEVFNNHVDDLLADESPPECHKERGSGRRLSGRDDGQDILRDARGGGGGCRCGGRTRTTCACSRAVRRGDEGEDGDKEQAPGDAGLDDRAAAETVRWRRGAKHPFIESRAPPERIRGKVRDHESPERDGLAQPDDTRGAQVDVRQPRRRRRLVRVRPDRAPRSAHATTRASNRGCSARTTCGTGTSWAPGGGYASGRTVPEPGVGGVRSLYRTRGVCDAGAQARGSRPRRANPVLPLIPCASPWLDHWRRPVGATRASSNG